MESICIRCCRLGRRQRNSVDSRRIYFYACCIGNTVSCDVLAHGKTETYRHATHAVETQRLLEGSSSSCKACFFRLRCLGLGAWIAPDVAWWPTASCARFCDMIIHVQYLDSHDMFSISSETKTMREVPLLTDAVLLSRGGGIGDGDAVKRSTAAVSYRSQQAMLSHVFFADIC
jgi:hypothetical protein